MHYDVNIVYCCFITAYENLFMGGKIPAITFEDVMAAVHALRADGTRISILSVREKLGRGSFSTVKKHLEHIARQAGPVEAAAIPAQLESLWNEARRAAEAELKIDREQLQVLATELDARLDRMQAQVEDSERSRQATETRLLDRTAELQRSLAQLDDLRRHRDHIENRRETAEAALTAERQAGQEHWARLTSVLTELQHSVAGLQASQTATEDLVREYGRTLSGELKAVAVLGNETGAATRALLKQELAKLATPLASVPGSLEQVERQLLRLSRKLVGRGIVGTRRMCVAPERSRRGAFRIPGSGR